MTVPPGQSVVSDPVALAFVRALRSDAARPQARRELPCRGRERTDDLARQGAADLLRQPARQRRERRQDESEARSPSRPTSWYFLDEVDMSPAGTRAIVAFGDSITDGTGTTINGDDRWPDVLSRRLHAAYGDAFAVVNQGIGGNQVAARPTNAAKPIPGGPARSRASTATSSACPAWRR